MEEEKRFTLKEMKRVQSGALSAGMLIGLIMTVTAALAVGSYASLWTDMLPRKSWGELAILWGMWIPASGYLYWIGVRGYLKIPQPEPKPLDPVKIRADEKKLRWVSLIFPIVAVVGWLIGKFWFPPEGDTWGGLGIMALAVGLFWSYGPIMRYLYRRQERRKAADA